MTKPKLTIIIPTRDREEYLPFAIQSCLDSNYQNLEVLVCDNSSTEKTVHVCNSFKDNRLKWIKPNTFLSMVANWEFALNQVEEGYVAIIGDDDAFIASSIEKAIQLLTKYKLEAICWRYGSYRWPGNEFAKINDIYELPIRNGYEFRNPNDFLQKVLDAKIHPNNLPSIYHGIIHINVIKEVKENGNGRFFNSRIPDYYALITFSKFVDKYIYSFEPFTISGSSPKSNGNAQVQKNEKFNSLKSNFSKGESDISFYSTLEFVHVYSILIWEAWLQMIRCYGVPQFSNIVPQLQFNRALKEISAFKIYDLEVEKLKIIAKNYKLEEVRKPSWLQSNFYFLQYHLYYYWYFWTSSVFIDCRATKITNVLEASRRHYELKRFYGSNLFINNIRVICRRVIFKYLYN